MTNTELQAWKDGLKVGDKVQTHHGAHWWDWTIEALDVEPPQYTRHGEKVRYHKITRPTVDPATQKPGVESEVRCDNTLGHGH